MKKQVCSSLLALTMTLGTVTPALAAETETENNVQSAACTCTAACTEETRNMDCAVCGAEGAPLTDCAQVDVQDDTNNEQQTANAENGFEYAVNEDGESVTLTKYSGSDTEVIIPSELGGKPVTAIGEDAFYQNKTITSVKIPEGVMSIEITAFRNCSSLTEVTIPKSVTSIGWGAFVECDALTTVHYGGTQKDWDALKKNIGEGNAWLLNANIIYSENSSDYAYSVNDAGDGVTITKYNGEAKTVVIPSELGGKPVTEIGIFAFALCDSLTEVTIPEGVTSIGNAAFSGCSSLTEVTIPKSVTSIGDSAFYNCDALKTVYYGGSQTDWGKISIGSDNDPLLKAEIICAIQESNGFAYTVTGDEATITGYTGSAKNLVIPSELGGKPVTAIGEKAFEGYKNIVNIYIPKTIKAIGEDAFLDVFDRNRSNLFVCYQRTKNEWGEIEIQKGNDEIDLPDNSVTEDGRILLPKYECNLSGDMVYQASDDAATLVHYFGSDSKVNIPAELGGKPVTEIGEFAFTNCSGLTKVTIPEGVTSIGAGAFQSCGSLTEVNIPKSVETIGNGAFGFCSSLTKVTIPEGVTSIKDSAFANCSRLTEVTIPKSVTSIGERAFYQCEALTTVHYGGTQEDWDALKNTIDNGNNPLLNANIICAIQESNGFAYTVTGDEATITGYTGSAENIAIPSELGGKPVTAIADKAFYGYKTPNIYIPKTIKAIGEDAFARTVSSDKFRFICYEGTENEWANIAIQKGNEELDPKYADDTPWFRLYECNLSGDMVYQASDDAATLARYFGADSKVDIPAELGGKPVTSIGEYAFVYCNSLTEVTIPEGVTSIGEWAFEGCSNLTKAIIPEGVTSIGKGAFLSCRSLTEVTIPKSVTSIGELAFYGCEALATVYYGGTQEDWDALKKNIGEDNTPLLNANIICKEKPKICKGGKEVKISNGAHEMRIHGKSYGTFTFAWVNDKAGWSIQNADGKYLSFDNGKLVLRDTAYVWKYDAKFYTTTEEKTSSGWGWWGWWGRPSTKVTNWYLVGDGTDLSISKSDTNADVKLYDAMESTEHSFGKWTPAEDGKHTRTCTICGATETGDCTYENGACTVCGALDPDNASVSVSATVTKRTSGGGGWWWWNRPTTTTWEARITATGTGVDIDKVEYSDDGKHYLTGTSFTSDTEITKFYIRVTDSKGNVTNWLYENGKVTQK